MEEVKSSSRIERVQENLYLNLVEGEKIEAIACQKRLYTIFPILTGGNLFPLIKRRDIIAVTSGRFILMKRKLIMGYDLIDMRWQDIGDVKLEVGIFGADLSISQYASTDLSIDKNIGAYILKLVGFQKERVYQIYRLIQQQEQIWREKRRIRGLEELRAKSGGMQMNQSLGRGLNGADTEKASPSTRLAEAKKMLDDKLISDSEYEALKAKIINEMV
ncbi:PH domain-containing protein [Ornithobacterium rhinotracheale]|uniref:PH domain-containing protein n=1 Tax=Ornithobacterium rhinotracheale TaxID=28251 RepID=UPI001FF4F1C5|nr:PH domain-containing protein [Ornithobacterium rhinotracheale]MCK0202348.1 PH domain-containing protein [Ornithobacterium rhinotracheale]